MKMYIYMYVCLTVLESMTFKTVLHMTLEQIPRKSMISAWTTQFASDQLQPFVMETSTPQLS